jgi:osmoprotectant transport system permease protein
MAHTAGLRLSVGTDAAVRCSNATCAGSSKDLLVAKNFYSTLFLYALLPIVRNTCTGILQASGGLRLAALALGLTPRQRLCQIDLPLALPVILTGIQTAAVMSVGTATITAFIGAGRYGERIAVGLALNNMLLARAIPAAQGLFEVVKRCLPGPRL